MKKRLILFDLDGTLLDTLEDLAAAVDHALTLRGLPLHTLDEYRAMVGHGVRNLVKQALPEPMQADDAAVDAALADFRAYYEVHIDEHTHPYPGIPELLTKLQARGVRMAIASNKFQEGTEYLVRRLFPGISFVAILGNRPGWPLKPDPGIVQEVLSRSEVAASDAMMVGDSPTDMRTASNGGIDALAVSWGYRTSAELEAACPGVRQVHSVPELRIALLGNPLLSAMLAQADPSQVDGLARFFKTGPGQYGFGDQFLGIKVPVTRAVVRDCWKSVSFDDLEECIRSEYHEVRLAALLTLVEIFRRRSLSTASGIYFSSGIPKNQIPFAGSPTNTVMPDRPASFHGLSSAGGNTPSFHGLSSAGGNTPSFHGLSVESLRGQCIDFYLSHTRYINNWDLVDLSCYPLLGEWLLDSPDRSLLYNLARNGKTIWEQRIGIVSTMTFIRHGQLDDTFAIADILLHHPHDLIHKAVGWLLREAGKRDKARLVAFLQGPDPSVISSECEESVKRYSTMPRTMLRYAIEKFPEEDRQLFLKGEASERSMQKPNNQ